MVLLLYENTAFLRRTQSAFMLTTDFYSFLEKKWSMLLLLFNKFTSRLLHIIIPHLTPSQKLDCWMRFSFGKNSMWLCVGCLSVRNSSVDVLRGKIYTEMHTIPGRTNARD